MRLVAGVDEVPARKRAGGPICGLVEGLVEENRINEGVVDPERR
jgi:hypothetical protein